MWAEGGEEGRGVDKVEAVYIRVGEWVAGKTVECCGGEGKVGVDVVIEAFICPEQSNKRLTAFSRHE